MYPTQKRNRWFEDPLKNGTARSSKPKQSVRTPLKDHIQGKLMCSRHIKNTLLWNFLSCLYDCVIACDYKKHGGWTWQRIKTNETARVGTAVKVAIWACIRYNKYCVQIEGSDAIHFGFVKKKRVFLSTLDDTRRQNTSTLSRAETGRVLICNSFMIT